jgi:hypothetical protein
MSLPDRLRAFRRRNLSEQALIIEASLALLVTWCALRTLPWAWLSRPGGAVSPRATTGRSAKQLADLVASTAAALPVVCACLEQAMVTAWMLRRRGTDALLVIGGARSGPEFAAHAWVECNGEILGDTRVAARYTPLCRLPV